MLRLLADENFKQKIVSGLRRRQPDLDLVSAQEVGLTRADDPTVLTWAAAEGRIVITHDRNTMPGFAYERVRAGLPMPGVFEVSQSMPIGDAIEELLILAECSLEGEWEGRVHYVSLR
ncbi:MAG: DUF5615 family PIN-like protein [Dehalococcoidia bacterium]